MIKLERNSFEFNDYINFKEHLSLFMYSINSFRRVKSKTEFDEVINNCYYIFNKYNVIYNNQKYNLFVSVSKKGLIDFAITREHHSFSGIFYDVYIYFSKFFTKLNLFDMNTILNNPFFIEETYEMNEQHLDLFIECKKL
jgi:hypothetical protein